MRYRIFLYVIAVSLALSSCSLMKLNIESDAAPLGEDLLKVRIRTHNFAKAFFHEVMLASDSIMNNEKDRQIQLNALIWKINSSNEIKNTVFQNNPEIALLDTWIVTASMRDYLTEGAGADLFGSSQDIAVEAVEKMLAEIEDVAKSYFRRDFDDARQFVEKKCKEAPYTSLDFFRETVYKEWYNHQGIPDSLIAETVGTLPEVLADFSSRMTIGSEQTLMQTQWNGELLFKKSSLDTLDLRAVSDNFNKHFLGLLGVLQNGGKELKKNADIFRKDMLLFRDDLDEMMDSAFVFARGELEILRDSFRVERAAIMADLDRTSNRVVKTALQELRVMINDILFYVLLILIAILFIPFALGFLTGRAFSRRKNKEAD